MGLGGLDILRLYFISIHYFISYISLILQFCHLPESSGMLTEHAYGSLQQECYCLLVCIKTWTFPTFHFLHPAFLQIVLSLSTLHPSHSNVYFKTINEGSHPTEGHRANNTHIPYSSTFSICTIFWYGWIGSRSKKLRSMWPEDQVALCQFRVRFRRLYLLFKFRKRD